MFVVCLICSLLFIGSYVGLQFYKGTLNTPTTSSATVTVTPSSNNNSNTNTNTATSNTTPANRTVSNTTDDNSTTNSTIISSTNTTQPQKLQVLILNDNATYNPDEKEINQNSLSKEETAIASEKPATNTKNIDKNNVYQTTTSTDITTSTTSTTSSNAIEKACLDKAYGYLNTSFIVIGGAILFLNGKIF